MSKPKSVPVPGADDNRGNTRQRSSQQQPLSGSKQTKQNNHVSHNNPQG